MERQRHLRPRKGLPGVWDRVMGPGGSALENAGTLFFAFFGSGLAFLDASLRMNLPTWLSLLAAVLAFDVVTGVWVLGTPSARRWYQRPGLGLGFQLAFSAGHVHPFLVAWLFPGVSWAWAGWVYGAVVLGTLGCWSAPPRVRPPLALVLSVAIVAVAAALAPGAPVWIAPALALKLLAARSLPPPR